MKRLVGLVLVGWLASGGLTHAQEGGQDGDLGGWIKPGDFRSPVASDRDYAAAVVERLRPTKWGGLKSLRAPERPDARDPSRVHPAIRGVYFHMAVPTGTLTVCRLRTKTENGASYMLDDWFKNSSTGIANSSFVGERRGADVVFLTFGRRQGPGPVGGDVIHSCLVAAWKGKPAPAQRGNLTISRYGPSADGGDWGTRDDWATFTQTRGGPYGSGAFILKQCRTLATVEGFPPGPARAEWEKLVAGPSWERMRRAKRRFADRGQNDLLYELEGTLGRIRVSTGTMICVGGRTAAGRDGVWVCALDLLERRGTPSVLEEKTVEVEVPAKGSSRKGD